MQLNLPQSPITCETGPGNPSGHVMINMVTGLTLVHYILSNVNTTHTIHLVVQRMTWNAFYIGIGMVVASRLLVLAHFPHQCLLAIVFGYFCFEMVNRIRLHRWSLLGKVSLATFFLGSALGIYVYAESFLGFDLDWSLKLASKHCQKVRKQDATVIIIII